MGMIAPIATGTHAHQTFDPRTIAVGFNFKASAVSGITIATEFVYVLAVQLIYTPRLTFGHSTRPARMLADGLQPALEVGAADDL
jgi:hypothetical protein